MKTDAHGRVTPICLARSPAFVGISDGATTLAAMAEACELAMNAIAPDLSQNGSGLPGRRRRPHSLLMAPGSLADLAEVFYRSRASARHHRDRDPFSVTSQANKSGMLHEARLQSMRLCAGQPA